MNTSHFQDYGKFRKRNFKKRIDKELGNILYLSDAREIAQQNIDYCTKNSTRFRGYDNEYCFDISVMDVAAMSTVKS
jgi:capsid portal protein